MVTLQDMADALDLKPKKDRKGFAAYGEIKSINPDNTYQVSLNGSDTTVKCARLTGAHVGDVVLVNVLDNGYAVVTGCVGGDTDAGDALDLATEASGDATTALNVAEGVNDHFWYDNTGAHVTEDTQEDYQQDPSNAGGNTLITSQGMAIRKGTTELASFSGNNGIIIGKTDEIHIGINDARGLSFYKPNETDTKAYISPIVTQGQLGLYLNSNTVTLTRSYDANIQVESTDNKAVITLSTSESTTGGRAAISLHHDGTVLITGDIDAAGKATLGAINGTGLFDYTTVSMTSSSIGANASGEVTSSASTKSKYYPLAITNVNISTGQASLRRFYFSTQEGGRAVVKIGLQNDGTSAKTISVSADILWVKIAV